MTNGNETQKSMRKGQICSPELRLKLSLSHIGINNWSKGKRQPHSEETKQKMREARLRNPMTYWKGKTHSIEARRKMSTSALGKPKSIDARKKMSESKKGLFSGQKHPNWIKDRTKLKHYFRDERRSSIYTTWRKQVRDRDSWKCKISNNECSGRLEVHHILGFTEHPELRYEINNGITLCHFHHPKVRQEEKRLIPTFQELVSVSKE